MAAHPIRRIPVPSNGPERDAIEKRFWEKVRITEGCWEWQAHSQYGYGRFQLGWRQSMLAHRVSWVLENGPIPKGLLVRHKCDNRKCVRPDHLELGTSSDNNWDMARRGRHGQQIKTHCKHGHDLSVYAHVKPNGHRRCLECHRLEEEVRRAKRKKKSHEAICAHSKSARACS